MKASIIKFTISVLLLAVSSFSCSEKEDTGGDVPYKPCPCHNGEERPYPAQFPEGIALLFRDSMPPYIHFEVILSSYIVFDSKTNNAKITMFRAGVHYSEICNFPEFVKKWNIPEKGCLVYFKGIAYVSCVPKYGVSMVTHSDCILEKLIKVEI